MSVIAKGIWPTMITPYDAQGNIDYGAVRAMVDWYIEKKCHGLFAVCQSSEMFYLSLDERRELSSAVMRAVDGRVDVVVSGHISEKIEEQIHEIRTMADCGAKAVVLVTNRMAHADEGDEIWIRNTGRILDQVPDVVFGLYECPYPHKRLLTERTLTWCARTGRFAFLKDTCCDAAQIAQKLNWIRNATDAAGISSLGLYNANTATLLRSLLSGADGYSGTMANLHPELYVWLWENYKTQPKRANTVQAALSLLSLLEGQGYPLCAKQHFRDIGIPMRVSARSVESDAFGDQQATILNQAEDIEALMRRELNIS